MRQSPVDYRAIERMLVLLGEYGRTTAGGVSRFAYTPEDKLARKMVMQWMQELHMTVRVDAVGNIIGRLGPEIGAAVALGSHLDSVPNGGIYDGPLGVTTALAVVKALQDQQVDLSSPLEVIVFSDEEGARFGGGLFGSLAMSGHFDEVMLERKDQAGISMREAMQNFGLLPANFAQAKREPTDFKAYLEVHIEQATVLEDAGCGVGIVKAIAGPVHFNATYCGRTDHAGATPMHLRQDALLGACEAALAAEDIALRAGETTVATVGQLEVFPGAVNVIPGRVELSFDVRDINLTDREWAIHEIVQKLEEIAEKRSLELTTEMISSIPPVELSSELVTLCERVAVKRGISTLTMVSGAAHDAMNMAELTDVVMLFVRSQGGVSHCPEEYSLPEDIQEVADLLFFVVEQLVAKR